MISVTLILAAVQLVAGEMFKNQPSVLMTARYDPIISPGGLSGHVHGIFGASGIVGAGLNTTYEELQASECTSNSIVEDKSAYWSPELYFAWANGSFSHVNRGDASMGMNVYYYARRSAAIPDEKIVEFPKGFRMIAGSTSLRSGDDTQASSVSISFSCYGVGEIHTLPQEQVCDPFMRAQTYFPSCWDGKSLDSDDHKSHVSFPLFDGTNDYQAGSAGDRCPDSHPVRLPTIFYERFYQMKTDTFNWYDHIKDAANQTAPFTMSNGDPTGRGYHSDFVNAWDEGVLQNMVELCPENGDGAVICTEEMQGRFLTRNEKKLTDCQPTLPALLDEPNGADGQPIDQLPGDNPVHWGEKEASPVASKEPLAMSDSSSLPSMASPTDSMAYTTNAAGPMTGAVKAIASEKTSSVSASRTRSTTATRSGTRRPYRNNSATGQC